MMIGILSRRRGLHSTRRRVAAAQERGHGVEVVDPLRCYMNITSRRPSEEASGVDVAGAVVAVLEKEHAAGGRRSRDAG